MPKAQMSITSTMCLILTCEPTAARIGRAPKAFGKSAVFRLLIFRMERLRGTLDSLVFAVAERSGAGQKAARIFNFFTNITFQTI